MPKTHTAPPSRSWLWRRLTSIRLTVFLLLMLAALAVMGTVLPQNQPAGFYVSRYGATWGRFLWRAGLSDVYYSPWFLALVSLLALNIVACVVQGLPQAIRRCRRSLTGEAALTLPERGRFTWPAAFDPRPLVQATLRRELGSPRLETRSGQEFYLYERGRFRPLGPYLVHLALLLILSGGLIGKFWGVEGNLPLVQGEEAPTFQVKPGEEAPLGFTVRLDQFQVQFYEKGGTPKEFRSDLTFFQDGKETARATCRVNEPVSFGGYTFYQSSYGAQPGGPARFRVRRGDRTDTVEAPFRRLVDLPGGQAQLMAVRVDGNLQGYGPAVQVALKQGVGHPQVFWVLKDHPEAGEQPPGPYRFAVESLPFAYYSVFQVKRDPGVGWVYAGFILLLPGFYLAFFRPSQRWAVVLEQTSQGLWQGRLLGASPRNREEFAACQERLLAGLKTGGPS